MEYINDELMRHDLRAVSQSSFLFRSLGPLGNFPLRVKVYDLLPTSLYPIAVILLLELEYFGNL